MIWVHRFLSVTRGAVSPFLPAALLTAVSRQRPTRLGGHLQRDSVASPYGTKMSFLRVSMSVGQHNLKQLNLPERKEIRKGIVITLVACMLKFVGSATVTRIFRGGESRPLGQPLNRMFTIFRNLHVSRIEPGGLDRFIHHLEQYGVARVGCIQRRRKSIWRVSEC